MATVIAYKIYDGTQWVELALKSAIPTVGTATLTIQKNGSTVASFGANATSNVTANISVPTTLDDISDGSTRKLANYLPLSGGAMTGPIQYKGTKATYAMIKWIDNTGDTYGNGINIGGGGSVVIGAGESSDAIVAGASVSGGTEVLFLGSDQDIKFYSNVQSGYSSAKLMTFNADGSLTVPGAISEAGTALSSKYLGISAKAADADKLDGHDSSYFQVALPTTTTAGKVLKSTSVAGTVEWKDDNNANYYPSRSYSSGLQISTSSGVANTCALFVPDATVSQKGVLALTDTNLNTMINQLSTGSSDPTDNDYYISQYVGGGTTTVTYHRRPVSKLYNYMKGKMDSVYQAKLTAQTAYSTKGSATKVPQITTNALGQVTSITEVTITQPTVNNGVLTIKAGGTSKGTFSANQSGDTEINITASDLGLGDALHFIGVSTTAITDGGTQNPTISGYSGTAKTTGNVVLYDGKEFVWAGSAWEQLGDESSWALKTVSISAGTGLTGGGTLAADRTISLADNYGDTKNPYASKTANYVLAAPNGSNGAPSFRALKAADIPNLNASKINAGTFADERIASASTWNAKYSKPSGGIPASDLAESYYLASNPNGYTSNAGTVTSVRVQAGTGLTSSVNTAQSSSLNTTISIASGYKLPTTTEWNAKGTYSKPSGGIPASDLAEKYVRYDTNEQGLTDTQKSNARTNIGAGTSNFLGYTSSNKLNSNYITNNDFVDLTSDQSIAGDKTFRGSVIVKFQLGQVNNFATINPTGIEFNRQIAGPTGFHHYGSLLYPILLEEGGEETIATQEWVQSQGGGGGSQQYHHAVMIEEESIGAFYTFYFTFVSDYSEPIEDIEGLYNYLLDETDNLDVVGFGAFANCTYAGTSTDNRLYNANRIFIDGNGGLYIEGFATYTQNMLLAIDKAYGFICYGDASDYWGWDGRIRDIVTPQ